MKKQFVFILFVLIITIPFPVSYIKLHYEKETVRKIVKTKIIKSLNKKDLSLLIFSKEEILKILPKNEKEFLYQQKMYDVVDYKVTNDFVYLWCYEDYKESKIYKQIFDTVNAFLGKHSKKNETNNLILKFFNNLFFQTDSLFINAQFGKLIPCYFKFDKKLFSYIIPPTFPPPKNS